MDEPTLQAIVEMDEGARIARVRSPGIGWWTAHPRSGALVDALAPVGVLTRLHRRRALFLPAGVRGIVGGSLPADRRVPVEYAQLLFELAPIDGVESAAGAGRAGGKAAADPGPGAGTLAIVSPTDGTFYRGPGAGAPPFVEVGARVRAGAPLGLVEVMKTFNQVQYGGPGLPEEAVIEEIRCGDAQEVRAGQVLFLVRPG